MSKKKFIYCVVAVIIFFGLGLSMMAMQSCGDRDDSEYADEVGEVAAGPSDAPAMRVLESVVADDSVVNEIIRYPGFTVSYNRKHHLPNWVAWELTGDESRSMVTSRKNTNFCPDTKVRGCATIEDYKGSGLDRGHMAPAGDMKWSTDAMNSCFLLTNIVPQDRSLNAGAWNTLEEKCRQWAVRDSAVWIVCGPVLTDYMPRTIGDTGVTVPERFFKVIISPFSNPPRGIAFIMPNTNITGGIRAVATSIDEVEEITGLDFFSALPDDIEDEVESQNNFPQWSRR